VLLDGALVGFCGPIEPGSAGARKLKQQVFVAEIMLQRLFQQPLRTPAYTPLSRYPSVERDFSFVFDDHLIYQLIEESVRALALNRWPPYNLPSPPTRTSSHANLPQDFPSYLGLGRWRRRRGRRVELSRVCHS